LLYSFEDFSLDTARRELRRSGALIALQPQVFDLIEYSIRNRERVVSKDDLLAAVWNGRIVSESTLSTRINAARSAIGDSGGEQRLLRTAHGKGIRFVGAVREEEETVRKLAAIFAADVAGYSRLMGQDEIGTLRRLTACRTILDELIAAYRGRIFGSAGDSVVADFASAVDAIQCAVAVQEALAVEELLRFRIGVHVGDVIVQGDNLFGDGVNIAARLEALAEPGGICISGTVRDHIGSQLPFAFADLGEQQVKNIAQPLRAYRVRTTLTHPVANAPGSPLSRIAGEGAERRRREAGEGSSPALALSDKPSIAVLPFASMSGEPEQEFFADGIAEDIITALSRYSSLFVIARNSCFTYKGRAVDVKQVGRELGVRYVLEGSLRKAGNRIRVTAQLVDAETGKHVWAERYDRDLADIFAVQDEITDAVTTAIAPAVADAERHRAARKPPVSLDAWAAYQRGMWHLSKRSADDEALARNFFQQATDLDPNFSGGYTGLAFAQRQAAVRAGSASTETLSVALARRAVALDGNDAEARACLGIMTLWQADYEGALAEIEAALAISPNLADAYGVLGSVLNWSDRRREARVALEKSIRLDPRNPNLAIRLLALIVNFYLSGEYDAAIGAAKRTIRAYPDYGSAYRWLAAALGQVGRMKEAKEALQRAISIAPDTFDMYVRRGVPWHRPEDDAHMIEGLRKAGWES
jgi:adenylate cyclase